MPTLANKRKEYLDETYDEDLNPLEEPEEYKADAPVKRVDSHQRSGFAIIDPDDSLQNRAAINGNTYGVGDYVEGLGNIEDIDQYGNPTILPDDPDQPAFRLGRSEGRSEGKAEEPEEEIAAGKFHDDRELSAGEFLAKMMRLSGLKPAVPYQGEEPDEEQRLFMADKFGRSILEPEEEHQYMLDNIYPGLTDKQIDEAVWEDYNNSTEIKGTAFENPDGSFTADYEKPNGEVITIVTYGSPHGYDIPRANITGVAE